MTNQEDQTTNGKPGLSAVSVVSVFLVGYSVLSTYFYLDAFGQVKTLKLTTISQQKDLQLALEDQQNQRAKFEAERKVLQKIAEEQQMITKIEQDAALNQMKTATVAAQDAAEAMAKLSAAYEDCQTKLREKEAAGK